MTPRLFSIGRPILGLPLALLLGACSSSSPSDGTAGAAGALPSAGAPSAGSSGAISSGGASAGSGGSAAGSGGTSGAAAGSSAGGASGAGTAGSAGAAGGASTAQRSTGCGMVPTQASGMYAKFSETITGVDPDWAPRNYYVRLPVGYDPMRAYPTVFVGPGCGGTGDQGIPIFNASKADAIVIGLDPDPTGEKRQCFNSESYPDPEEPYFNATLKEVEAKYCVDKSKLFVEGFSSGSWLANLIGCVDGDVIRGQGNASGCMQGAHPTCKGPIAYMAAHDMADPNNSYQCGKDNRDRIVKLNGCSDQTMPYDPGPDIVVKPPVTVSCVQYVGCKPGYPVVWCTTTNLGHNDQVGTGLSTFGFWKFWMSLPPVAAAP